MGRDSKNHTPTLDIEPKKENRHTFKMYESVLISLNLSVLFHLVKNLCND